MMGADDNHIDTSRFRGRRDRRDRVTDLGQEVCIVNTSVRCRPSRRLLIDAHVVHPTKWINRQIAELTGSNSTDWPQDVNRQIFDVVLAEERSSGSRSRSRCRRFVHCYEDSSRHR